jgi:hypothetical protein
MWSLPTYAQDIQQEKLKEAIATISVMDIISGITGLGVEFRPCWGTDLKSLTCFKQIINQEIASGNFSFASERMYQFRLYGDVCGPIPQITDYRLGEVWDGMPLSNKEAVTENYLRRKKYGGFNPFVETQEQFCQKIKVIIDKIEALGPLKTPTTPNR